MDEVLEFKSVREMSSISDKNFDIRVLTPEEVESLRPEFDATNAIMPDPRNSFAVGAVDQNGKVVAFLFFQLQVHAEPMKIDHPYERLFAPLVSAAEQELVRRCGPCLVYAFTPAGKVTKLAQAAGMQMEPWVVMSKICGLPERV